jgi:hypothetical protein
VSTGLDEGPKAEVTLVTPNHVNLMNGGRWSMTAMLLPPPKLYVMPGPVDGTIEPQVDQQPQRSLVHRPQAIRDFGRIPSAREAIKPLDRAPSIRPLRLASGPEQDRPRLRCRIRADYATPAGGDGHTKRLFVSERALALTVDDWLSEPNDTPADSGHLPASQGARYLFVACDVRADRLWGALRAKKDRSVVVAFLKRRPPTSAVAVR